MDELLDQLWRAVETTFVACDFWCHSHGDWVNTNKGCGDECRTVPVFMRDRDGDRPFSRHSNDALIREVLAGRTRPSP